MYNDSDLELTAESLYRQGTTFMYVDDRLMFATFQKQSLGDYYIPHNLLHICLLCISYLDLTRRLNEGKNKQFIQ